MKIQQTPSLSPVGQIIPCIVFHLEFALVCTKTEKDLLHICKKQKIISTVRNEDTNPILNNLVLISTRFSIRLVFSWVVDGWNQGPFDSSCFTRVTATYVIDWTDSSSLYSP